MGATATSAFAQRVRTIAVGVSGRACGWRHRLLSAEKPGVVSGISRRGVGAFPSHLFLREAGGGEVRKKAAFRMLSDMVMAVTGIKVCVWFCCAARTCCRRVYTDGILFARCAAQHGRRVSGILHGAIALIFALFWRAYNGSSISAAAAYMVRGESSLSGAACLYLNGAAGGDGV